ncbi:hypothetical protein [Pedobacter africanus]|uniref:Uncharacterized protein n=1 Tax=Pedobacter africanus TaxID=151894 RepID=A0A1W1ZCC6_9SPHI|nr:hypothetical protein [Pedobacter africanus]SMC46084.1 hypothetical protein SAMN04488524_0595 [Pedobacter africanus]
MYRAKFIRTHHNIDEWLVWGNGERFYTEFMAGISQQEVEDFYNN